MAQRKYVLKPDKFDERDLLFNNIYNIHEAVKIPSQIDLRPKMPPVFDQGQEGSCTANAGCTATSMVLGHPELIFSRQYLYRKEREIEGTVDSDSGAQMRDIGKAVSTYGICLEQFMTYIPENLYAVPSKDADANAQNYKIKNYIRLTDLDHIKSYLAIKQLPILTGMTVYESMESDIVAAKGILPMPSRNEQVLGGHAVLIVGYIDNTNKISKLLSCLKIFNKPSGYVIVRNSWGEGWGQKGYFLMPYEYIKAGLASDFWVFE